MLEEKLYEYITNKTNIFSCEMNTEMEQWASDKNNNGKILTNMLLSERSRYILTRN
jgi:hypothetical protein